ncbi:hypothetical protein C4561_02275 [candidate division WWE3 bacterium]|jgi:hypothetical protein|uniref:Uncharacterized protein n=1 Tax=candidate division WWE3 bacterium TaxID=2053526 RepID=A0A3A4ZE77_UNCKA|nr:MAG: hypothetical protein C4561_02275 [candidate division WWE3 bacterium]
MKKYRDYLLLILIFFLVGIGVYSNIMQQNAVDQTKIPGKVEESRGFQRWTTNLRNKDVVLDADNFRLVEVNEVYNTKWMKVYSADDPEQKIIFEKTLAEHRELDKVIFSPSDREFIDFRNIDRGDYKSNEVRFYGQKEDKIIDSRVLDCSIKANCYIDRAYFLDNDVFVISEISRNIDKKDENPAICTPEEACTYTFKVHVVDLINNKRHIYESETFEVVLVQLIPEL